MRVLATRLYDSVFEKLLYLGPHLFPSWEDSAHAGPDVVGEDRAMTTNASQLTESNRRRTAYETVLCPALTAVVCFVPGHSGT